MLAVVTSAVEGMGPPSGWHYHPCDYQLILVMTGWIDLEAGDDLRTRLNVGDSIILPGYLRHNVVRTADRIEVLTVTVPATYDTVMCDGEAAAAAS